MAVRTDVTEDLTVSPRLLRIAAPSTGITCQDIVDTARDIERKLHNMDDAKLVDAVGKGGGGVTGIAVTLLNTQIYFEPRTTVAASGTVTTADSSGKLLIDSAADFSGVTRGAVVENSADESHAAVLQVNSSIELLSLALAGGSDNQYDLTDGYKIINSAACSVTGGDLFATDSTGGTISPILNTFGVGPLALEQDTSPAAEPLQPTSVVELDGSGNEITMIGAMQAVLAAGAGLLSGATSTDIRIRNQADTKDVIQAGVDSGGNRLTITLNLD